MSDVQLTNDDTGGQGGTNDVTQVTPSMRTAPIQQPTLQPVAQPTPIRFLEPAAPDLGQQNMENLARSLSSVDSTLQSYLDQKQQQQDDRDKINAEADFHKNNAEGYAQAVQEGKIPAYASQAYVQSYKETQGAVAGDDLINKFNAAYDGWAGKNSDDPNAYHDFVTGFLKQNIATDDPDVLRGLMPKVNQLVEQGQSQYIQDRHTATVNGSVDTHIANVDNGITNVKNDAVKSGSTIDLDAGWNVLMQDRATYLKSGGTPQQIDQKYIDTIASQAISAGGMDGHRMLTLLDRQLPGVNYSFSQTPYGQQKKLETERTLDSLDRQRLLDEKDKVDAANKAALGDVQQRALASIAANPGQPLPDSLIAEGTKYDPEFRAKVASWQDTLTKASGQPDQERLLQLNWSWLTAAACRLSPRRWRTVTSRRLRS